MNVLRKSSSVRMTQEAESSSMSADRKSEVSDSSSSHRARLSRFRLKMRMLSRLGLTGMTAGKKTNTVTYQNTYRTQPDDKRRFSQLKAEQIIYSVLEAYLSQRKYDCRCFPLLCKTLSELVKERVKATGLDRYKVVALVTICQNNDQGIRLTSRCLWDQHYDNQASVVYEGPDFFAVGSVYAVYFE